VIMPFFLQQFGLHLAKFQDEPEVSQRIVNDPPKPLSKPSISPLGFEVLEPRVEGLAVSSVELRTSVFKSFDNIILYVEDTKLSARVKLRVSENSLLVLMSTVNNMCSKMHVEDISPIDKNTCTHDDSGCSESHFGDDSLCVEPNDFLACDEQDAIFRIHDGMLRMRRGKRWHNLNLDPKLPDGYYSLELENF